MTALARSLFMTLIARHGDKIRDLIVQFLAQALHSFLTSLLEKHRSR